MCWCTPMIKTIYCGRGPCNPDDISEFRKIVREFRPDVAENSTLLADLISSYAQDFALWKKGVQSVTAARALAEATRRWFDERITTHLVEKARR